MLDGPNMHSAVFVIQYCISTSVLSFLFQSQNMYLLYSNTMIDGVNQLVSWPLFCFDFLLRCFLFIDSFPFSPVSSSPTQLEMSQNVVFE